MRILILGATGMLGHVACRILSGQHTVIALSRSKVSPELKSQLLPGEGAWLEGIDARDLCAVSEIVERERPQAVLNCIGLVSRVEEAKDPIQSIKVNSLLPHELARICDQHQARLIHISTDCVFSGRQGLYAEDQLPDPVDLYGRSKLLGEIDRPPHLTLRSSFIGYELLGGTGLVEWLISQAHGEIKGYNNAIYSGLTAIELVRTINKLLTEHPGIAGLYQVASEPISKYELLVKVNDILSLGITIHPDETFVCDRSLDGSRFTADSTIEIPAWDEMLRELEIQRHLYRTRSKT